MCGFRFNNIFLYLVCMSVHFPLIVSLLPFMSSSAKLLESTGHENHMGCIPYSDAVNLQDLEQQTSLCMLAIFRNDASP